MSEKQKPILFEADLSLTDYTKHLTTKVENGTPMLLCQLRKKYLVMQPEEWVRQLWIYYLISELNISPKKILLEKQFEVLGKKRRFDLIVLNAANEHHLLFELKSFKIIIQPSTFDQITLYNLKLKIPYLIASNGIQHYAFKVDQIEQRFDYLRKFSDILTNS